MPQKNEKETLSIVFVVKRFHEYLYTRKFTVINDYQPLKLIFGKFVVNCLPQIQRFFLCLQKYEFDLKYSPGKTMLVLDALSWAYIKNSKPEFDENSLIHYEHFVISNLPTSNKRLEQFKEERRKDPILQTLRKYTIKSWPEKNFNSTWIPSVFYTSQWYMLPWRATSQRSVYNCPSAPWSEMKSISRTSRHWKLQKDSLPS